MPSFILENPFHRYKKEKIIYHTSLRAKIAVSRNNQKYVLVMAPLEIDGIANNVESVVRNVVRLTHPNLVNVYEAYIHNDRCYWVMEDWTGGIRRGFGGMEEPEVARIVQKLVSAIRCMHEHGVVHGNLAFEDIQFYRSEGGLNLKIADLGIGRYVDEKEYMELHQVQKYGNPPEAKRGIFSAAGDIWTVGSVAYRLLTGDVKLSKLTERIDEFHQELAKVSPEARDFVLSCMQLDPTKRLTSEDALRHPWFRENRVTNRLSNPKVIKSLERVHIANQFKRLATSVVAKHSDNELYQEYWDLFEAIDLDGTGFIEYGEFVTFLSPRISVEESRKLFEYFDFKQDGRICFVEFVGATMQFKKDIPESKLRAAFDNMDFDNDGVISPQDLSNVLDLPEEKTKKYVAKAARLKKPPSVSFDKFKRMMRQDTTIGVRGWVKRRGYAIKGKISSLPEMPHEKLVRRLESMKLKRASGKETVSTTSISNSSYLGEPRYHVGDEDGSSTFSSELSLHTINIGAKSERNLAGLSDSAKPRKN